MANNIGLSDGNYGAPTRNPFNYEKFEQINRDIATPWLSLDQITQQLNLFGDESQDTYLSGLELATRQAIEDYLGMSIFPTSYRVYYNAASLYGTPLTLDLPEVSQGYSTTQPNVTINAVKFWTDATVPTLPSNLNASRTSPVFCDYTTVSNVYASYPVVQQAGLLLLTHLYNQRSDTTEGQLKNIPFGVAALLRPYKPLVM